MTLRMKILCLTALSLTLQGTHAEALRIDGLLPFEQQASGNAKPAVAAGVLEIPLPQRSLRISPWPDFLPQSFEQQQVDALRHPAPAGPTDRISMRAADGGSVWLELVAGARVSSPVVGGWKLKHTARGWWLAQGAKLHFLGQDAQQARPVLVPAGMERWCVSLLGSEVPATRPGVAPEGEAQAAWVALRMPPGQRCATGAAQHHP